MDRIEFFHSINYVDTDMTDALISLFDQHMLLYNLVDNIRKVSCEQHYLNNVQFIIDYISPEAADNNLQILSANNTVCIYGSMCYLIAEKISNASIRLSIDKPTTKYR